MKPVRTDPARVIPSSAEVPGVVDDEDVDWDTGPADDVVARDQWKQPVRAATTGTITIATALNPGDTLDGVTLADGDRVLVKDQSSPAQNGIYVVGSTPARAPDMDDDLEVLGAVVYVIAGTANEGTAWRVQNTAATVVGTDAIDWTAFGGASGSVPNGTDPGDILAWDGAAWDVLPIGGDGTVLTADSGEALGLIWATAAPGTELAYVERTSALTVTATSEATGQTVVSAGAVSFDGSTRVCIEFFAPYVSNAGTDSGIVLDLSDGGTEIGRMGVYFQPDAGDGRQVVMARRFLTPSAGSHTYSIQAWRVTSDGTVTAGAGGTNTALPAYIRITVA